MDPTKLGGAVLVGFVLLMIVLIFGSMLMEEVTAQEDNSMDVGDQLWEFRPMELLMLSVMMFAAVLGILKMVGGEFKWN